MNSSPSSGPLNRARQSNRHLELKQQVGTELARRGFEVMYEFRLADVVGIHFESGLILAIEIELSTRNLIGNLIRNLGNGFEQILIVVPPAQVERSMQIIAPHVQPGGSKANIFVTCTERLNDDLAALIREASAGKVH